VIRNARALTPDFVPEELWHRDGQIGALSAALRPLVQGSRGTHVIITGPSGVGKTTLARHVVQELERKAFDVTSGYVNCISDSTHSQALSALLRDSGRGADLRPEGTPTSAFIDRLRRLDSQFVALVDEVDILEDPLMLSALYDVSNVTLVLITVNEDDLLADLDSRVQSRLMSAQRIHLEKYHHAELCDILQARVDVGLAPGTVSSLVVERAADIAAGDARTGIVLLGRAVQRAQDEGRTSVTCADVDESRESALRAIHERNVVTLSTHQRVLYEILREAGELSAHELHERYEELAGSPRSQRSRRRYLRGLERYKMIRKLRSGGGTRYEFRGY